MKERSLLLDRRIRILSSYFVLIVFFLVSQLFASRAVSIIGFKNLQLLYTLIGFTIITAVLIFFLLSTRYKKQN